MKKILVAMSGGVDSAAACLLLRRQGYAIGGATMLLRDGGEAEAEDAQRAAEQMGIPFHLFEWKEAFQKRVIAPFTDIYRAGATPNPCVICNGAMKFGLFLERALALGYDGIATGHYARIAQENGRYVLRVAVDRPKDQTYVLCKLTQQQLSHTLFPLGDIENKDAVRALAAEAGLELARKHDSQDICFVPDGDYTAFLERYTGKTYPQGDFLDESGKVVGKHHGAVRYTIGQRKGLGLAMGEPVYVCGKDMQANTVTVGPNSSLFSSALQANDWNWFPFPELTEPMDVTVKIRHSQFEQPGRVFPEADGFARVEFAQPLRAVTPGQAVVLYQGDMVLGGGTITEAIR